MRFPSEEITGKMLLRWGLILVTIDAISLSLNSGRPNMEIDEVFVVPSRPSTQARYPAIVAKPANVRFETEGVNGFQIEQSAGHRGVLMYRSHGNMQVQVIGNSEEEVWSLTDFLTDQYLGGMVRGASWYRTVAQDVERIALAFNPGYIEWSDLTQMDQPWAPDNQDKLWTSTASIPFMGEHRYYFDFTNVSGITIEAIPEAPKYEDTWRYVNVRV